MGEFKKKNFDFFSKIKNFVSSGIKIKGKIKLPLKGKMIVPGFSRLPILKIGIKNDILRNMSLRKKIIIMVGSLLVISMLGITFSTLHVVNKDYSDILNQLLSDNVSSTKEKVSAISSAVSYSELQRKFKLMMNTQLNSFREMGYTPQILVIMDDLKDGVKIYAQDTSFVQVPQELIEEVFAGKLESLKRKSKELTTSLTTIT